MMRRGFLALATGLAAGAHAGLAPAKSLESAELALSELSLGGDPAFGRALLAVPRALPPKPELLVLLHGLGETVEQTMGSRAFAKRYGLLTAVARLTHPPLALLDERHDYFGAGRLAELNARLAQSPFRCPVLLCPFTPNTYKARGDEAHDDFGRLARRLSGDRAVLEKSRSVLRARYGARGVRTTAGGALRAGRRAGHGARRQTPRRNPDVFVRPVPPPK